MVTQGQKNAAKGSPSGLARAVVREIDRELNRLAKHEKALASERKLLPRARTALIGECGDGSRERVAQVEIAAYVAEHPGCRAAEIGWAVQAHPTSVEVHLYRGRDSLYEMRGDG